MRDPRTHLAILQAIGAGHHTLSDIAHAALVGRTHLSAYLNRLQELRLVERRLPVTVPPAQRQRSRQGRYHILDPYFRFYFRFIAPYRDELAYRPERVLPLIREACPPCLARTGQAGQGTTGFRRADGIRGIEPPVGRRTGAGGPVAF